MIEVSLPIFKSNLVVAMTFIFWQNVISIHQSAFIKALSERHPVVLVVERALGVDRVKEGWSVPNMGNATVIIAPDILKINELIETKDCHHIFSGIDAFPMVYTAFKKAVNRKIQLSVFAEPYDWRGLKGTMRNIKYWYLFKRYGKFIKCLFTTGRMGQKCYEQSGFSTSKIRQWGYFTEQIDVLPVEDSRTKPNIIFIGKLDERKNILSLIKAIKQCEGLYNKFRIIGNGILAKEVKSAIHGQQNIEHIGTIPNEDVAFYLSISDLLVLPSLFDGWGAVVNEALYIGTRVLCSEYCGAAVLLDEKYRGGTFNFNNESDLMLKLRYWLQAGCLSVEQRKKISDWAKTRIKGDVVAKYFIETLNDTNKHAPWLS